MLTIHSMPNWSSQAPYSSPQTCFSSGMVTVPVLGQLLPVPAQFLGVVAAEAHHDVVSDRHVLHAGRGVRAPSG